MGATIRCALFFVFIKAVRFIQPKAPGGKQPLVGSVLGWSNKLQTAFMETTEKSEGKQIDKPWLFKKGQSGNPKGKPKGTFSLKTYAKKYLQEMTDEEKIEFMEGLPKEVIWKMAEGNPKQDTDVTTNGESLNTALVQFIDGKDSNNSNTGGVQETV